ncbi:tail protein X [Brevibacillus ruminantium]|uniref:Tail protein X n=1 Tax=Brevibacillus ruminantium TaxID=2950604 RepID=A0ABY4WS87_9BACL|nr:tail protein X [Brevibacillus ruminantium]USG67451.1 tail protein X [Brevibacillus ruminantium]
MSRQYVTSQGEMWDGIAKKTLGSEYQMNKLIDANPAYRNLVIFPANIRLSIPEPDDQIVETLPPWKRGGTG